MSKMGSSDVKWVNLVERQVVLDDSQSASLACSRAELLLSLQSSLQLGLTVGRGGPGSFRVIIWIIKDNYCYKHSGWPTTRPHQATVSREQKLAKTILL